jgi:hypothetical protein
MPSSKASPRSASPTAAIASAQVPVALVLRRDGTLQRYTASMRGLGFPLGATRRTSPALLTIETIQK